MFATIFGLLIGCFLIFLVVKNKTEIERFRKNLSHVIVECLVLFMLASLTGSLWLTVWIFIIFFIGEKIFNLKSFLT